MSEISNSILEVVPPLPQDQREQARETARQSIVQKIGPQPPKPRALGANRPAWEQFNNRDIPIHPNWLLALIASLLFLAYFGAMATSVFRIFTIGRDHFLQTIPDHPQAAVAGVALVILSETIVVSSTIARRVFVTRRRVDKGHYPTKDRTWWWWFPIGMGAFLAYAGNIAVAEPTIELSVVAIFSWLEAVVPTTAVIFLSVIGENIILSRLESRYENKVAFKEALEKWEERQVVIQSQYDDAVRAWEQAINNPEDHADFQKTWANYLWDALRDHIYKGLRHNMPKQEKWDYINSITVHEKRLLVSREMFEEDWFAPITGGVHEPVVNELVASDSNPTLPVVGSGSQPQQQPQTNYGFATPTPDHS